MYKVLLSLAIVSLVSVGYSAKAQAEDAASTAPTEVGTTTMPAGQYSLIEQSTGKKYSLMITTKGTMICGPVATTSTVTTSTTTTKTSGLEGLAKSQMQKGMTNLIEKQGMSEFKSLVK